MANKTITFTTSELDFLIGAAEMRADMENDMMFDNVESVNLFPRDDSQVELLTVEKAKALRAELYEVMQRALAAERVLLKLKG